jgi:cobalt/nickel transport system permease protein
MHIADGILSTKLCVAAQVAAWGSVYVLGRRIDASEVTRMGLLAAASFVVSLIHFPLGPSTIHLGLFGFAGILLGSRAFPVIFATLLFQALIFQHGGLLSLGINSINMGVGALLAWLVWKVNFLPETLRAFLGGFVGIFLPALLMALEFSVSGYGKGFYFIAMLYLGVACIEGLLTLGMITFLKRVKPEVLAIA